VTEQDSPSRGADDSGHVDAELFVRISDRLRNAFAQVARAELPSDQKSRWQRRLIAITDTAKRDLVLAEEQLERFAADWSRTR
jgi:hypothetical protein